MRRRWLGAALLVGSLALAAHVQARAPFARGILLRGTVVTMDGRYRGSRTATCWCADSGSPPSGGGRDPRHVRVGGAVVVAPRGALILPGLINLHDHPSWSMLPPWPPPSSDAQPAFGRPLGTEPYANRYQWNGGNGFDDAPPEQSRLVSVPHDVLTSPQGPGLAAETVKWAEIRGLRGGQTSEQGAAPDPATDRSLARDVDNVNFGADRVETSTFPGRDPALVAEERAGQVDAFIAGVPKGDETFASIRAALADSLAPFGIQLSPILPEDDHFRFAVIEGARDADGKVADPAPPFALYPSNVNQDQPPGRHPFDGFQARWYGGG